MSTYLIRVEETYRADTEAEAVKLIADAKLSNCYTLAKYSSTKREAKQKGEVVDEWYRVVLTKQIDSEKEPISSIKLNYEPGDMAF